MLVFFFFLVCISWLDSVKICELHVLVGASGSGEDRQVARLGFMEVSYRSSGPSNLDI